MSEFVPVIAEADFPEDGKYAATLNGWQVLVARVEGGFHAFNDRCPHAASALSGGRVRRGAIMCPLHGARFDLTTGQCIGGAYAPLRQFEARVRDGQVEVAIPPTLPGMEDLPVRIAS